MLTTRGRRALNLLLGIVLVSTALVALSLAGAAETWTP